MRPLFLYIWQQTHFQVITRAEIYARMDSSIDLEKSDWLEPNGPRFIQLVNNAQIALFKRLYAPMGVLGEPGVNAYVGSSPVPTEAIAPFLHQVSISVTASTGRAVLTPQAISASISPFTPCFIFSMKGKPAGKTCAYKAFTPQSQYSIDFSEGLKFFREQGKFSINRDGYNLYPAKSYDLVLTVARYPLPVNNVGQESEFPEFMAQQLALYAGIEYAISIRDNALKAQLEQEIVKGI